MRTFKAGLGLLLVGLVIAAVQGQSPAPRGLLNLTGHYYDDPDSAIYPQPGSSWAGPFFDRLIMTRNDPNIDFKWTDLKSPATGVGTEYWSARWTGTLQVPRTDEYRFFLENLDDAARLYLDDDIIIDAWKIQPVSTYVSKPLRLEKGTHALKLEFHQGPGPGASIRLAWESRNLKRQTIEFPDGLQAEYFEDPDQKEFPKLHEPPPGPVFTERVGVRTENRVDFNWGPTPHLNINDQAWSVRWTGKLLVPKDDDYTFFFDNLEDGGRLYVDGELLIDAWREQDPATHGSKPVRLKKGVHDIVVEYHQGSPSTASITLSWESNSFAKEVIPPAGVSPPSFPPAGGGDQGGGARRLKVDFKRNIAPILSKAGCNGSACHGSAEGRGGFKLSLFGQDPRADYEEIVNGDGGRRVNRENPLQSLIVRKPTLQTAHGGGLRFTDDSPEYQSLRQWLEAGMPLGNPYLEVEKLEVKPEWSKLTTRGQKVQLTVTATFANGEQLDVTKMARYSTNDETVVKVDSYGKVTVEGTGETVVVVQYLGEVALATFTVPARISGKYPNVPPNNFIDTVLFYKLKMLGIVPSELCTDSEFIRRAYLDAIGVLPTVEEVRRFLADKDPKKRDKLVDALLERPEYADWWAMRFGDLLRCDRNSLNEQGARAFHAYLRESFAHNKPYDQFVRELIGAEGNRFQKASANYYFTIARTPEDLAITTSQVFLGVRIECARCHNHPFDRWKRRDFWSFAAFFARVGLQGDAVITKPPGAPGSELQHPDTKEALFPKLLDGDFIPYLPPEQTRHRALAEWIASPYNPYFAKAAVNRIWKYFFGRGLVEPADDFRISNPPVSPALLDRLAKDFVEHRFDLKHLMRLIMKSRTYQLSWRTNPSNAKDRKFFSHYYPKRLTAEQLLDALNQVCGTQENFPGFPAGTRAMQLFDTRVPSVFLDLFGRPNREVISDRMDDVSVPQVLHLINSPEIQQKLSAKDGRIAKLKAQEKSFDECLDELYLAALCRYPTPEERRRAQLGYASEPSDVTIWEWLEDQLWALLNSWEFLYNH